MILFDAAAIASTMIASALAPAVAPAIAPRAQEAVSAARAGAGGLDDLVFGRLDLYWVLFAVPIAIACYLWASRQRRRALRSLGNHALIERLVQSVHVGNRTIAAVLTVLALALIGVGLLRLQYGGIAQDTPQKRLSSSLDIVLAVDYSKSMLARDVYPSRSERLEAELRRFFDRAHARGDRVGLVVFAGAARGLPLSRDMRLLNLYLQKADPLTENPGGTAIGKALRLALNYLIDARRGVDDDAPAKAAGEGDDAEAAPPAESDQVIILLTDGEDTSSRPAEMAEEARKLGVRIYTVAIGSRSGEPIQKFTAEGAPDGYQTDADGNYLMTRVDEGLLQELAKTTGGRYVHIAPDRFGLDEVESWMSELSRAQREETVEIHREEGYVFMIVPALALLALTLAIGDRRRLPEVRP